MGCGGGRQESKGWRSCFQSSLIGLASTHRPIPLRFSLARSLTTCGSALTHSMCISRGGGSAASDSRRGQSVAWASQHAGASMQK
eukprot:6201611-Pleurochrysis_carterae.AAC.2